MITIILPGQWWTTERLTGCTLATGFCSTTRAQGGERRLSQERSQGKISTIFLCGYLSFLGFLGIFAHHDTRFWSKETILSNQSGKSFYYCGSVILHFLIKALKGETFVTRYVSNGESIAGYFQSILPHHRGYFVENPILPIFWRL